MAYLLGDKAMVWTEVRSAKWVLAAFAVWAFTILGVVWFAAYSSTITVEQVCRTQYGTQIKCPE